MTNRTLGSSRHEIQLYPSKYNALVVDLEVLALVGLIAVVAGVLS